MPVIGRDIFLALVLALSGGAAAAGPCDWRPSVLLTGVGSAAVAGAAGVTAAVGPGMSAAGFYTLTNATTGATMLASTAAGSSAAGTAGIIAGTGTGLGAMVAVISAPATVIAATALAGVEGFCYFQDERITDYREILAIMNSLAEQSDPDYFRVQLLQDPDWRAVIVIRNDAGVQEGFELKNLEIVNGQLIHHQPGLNRVLGDLGYVMAAPAAD